VALETIILKCLKKNVDDRYPDAQALREDLLHHFPDYGREPIDLELTGPAESN
jgi:hypothetical protein